MSNYYSSPTFQNLSKSELNRVTFDSYVIELLYQISLLQDSKHLDIETLFTLHEDLRSHFVIV